MTIYLQNYTGDPRAIRKSVSTVATLTGTLRNESNVIDPEILIDTSDISLTGFNYAEIPDFGRKYFVKEIRTVRNGITQISLRCDPLASFADYILSLPVIAKRTGDENNPDSFSPYIVDPRQEFKAYHTTRSYVVGDLDAAGLSPVFILATVST